MAEAPSLPMVRSPSQCPGTARSSASAGRSLIITIRSLATGLAPDAAGAQRLGQLPTQLTPALDVEGLVDGLVDHVHLRPVGKLGAQGLEDLFRAPP